MGTRNRRLFVLAAVVMIAAVLFGLYSPVNAAGGVGVILSTGQTSFAADQPVLVQVTVSNAGTRPVKVLKWYTPAEDAEEALFNVTLNGQPVQYLGAIYKRPAPTGADYVNLKPGEQLTQTVDLAASYDLSASGNYIIRYEAASPNLFSEKGGGVTKRFESLTSNEVTVWVEGRSSGPVAESVTPNAVTGTTSYVKCSASQQADAAKARAQASTYSAGALSYLSSNKQGSRYTTWFGTYLASRYSTVKSHFTSISSAMDTAPVTINCGCNKNYYAYVYANKPYTIYVCKVFWTAPLTGTDSKAGTLIHEMSHFTVTAGTNDYVYGQSGAKSLAISDPNKAINNADNHEYFAENTPALP